LNLKVF